MFFDAGEQRGVEQAQVAAQGVERGARGGLFLQHQADGPEVGELAPAGQAQRKIFHAAGLRAVFQQGTNSHGAERRFGVFQAARRKPGAAQHGVGIETHRLREIEVARQAGAAHDGHVGVIHECPNIENRCPKLSSMVVG
ncbi:hypothetical protein D9M69_660440 [compost metagenome]